jgi:hypothetical protein
MPTRLSIAPSALKSVVPTDVIVYVCPTVKKPAVKGMRCLLYTSTLLSTGLPAKI